MTHTDLIAKAEAHAEWLATHEAFETEDLIRDLITALRAAEAENAELTAFRNGYKDTIRRLQDSISAAEAENIRLRAWIANPPKHDYWSAGEPDCPREIKAGNGELYTLRCKVCGHDNPRDEICRALGGENHD